MKESMRTAFLQILIGFFLTSSLALGQGISPASSSKTGNKRVFVKSNMDLENYLDSLSAETPLREKIAQLFIISAKGRFTNQDSRDFQELSYLIEKQKIGGIVFMQGDIYGQAVLTNKLQRISEIPLWITQDMELGAAMRIEGTTPFSPAMGVAASGDKRNAFMMGKITALEAKAVGVHQIFAPVLDVNNNPDNPVINIRSFSGDPNSVSEFGTAFIHGVQSEGVVATAKHFPGHGDTEVDSHAGLPVIDYNYAHLDSVELLPFKAAIDGGISSIMSAHIAFPGIDGGELIPGTLDPAILGDILSDSLNFKGLVVTDGLGMRGISSNYSPGQAVVKALQAGADIMLISPDVITAINEVEAAVEKGKITEERINRSFEKMIRWKKEYGLFNTENQVDISELDSKISTSFSRSESERIARESITILKNEDDILPIHPDEYPQVLVVSVADDRSGSTGSTFARYFRDYHPDVSFYVHDGRTTDNERENIIQKAQQADLVVMGLFVNPAYLGSVSLSSRKSSLMKRLQEVGKPSVLVSFGNPYVFSKVEDSEVQVIGWYNTPAQIKAVVSGLFGASKVQGKLPIKIPGMYDMKTGVEIEHTTLRFGEPEEVELDSKKLFELDHIINDAIRDSVFPGATVAIMKDGVLAYTQGYGYQDYSKTKAVRPTDIYDLASITKVVATTTSVMKLIGEGKLNLQDKVAKYIPEYDTDEKKHITIADLLLHQSGLPPFRVYVDSIRTRKEIVNAIKNEPLVYETGTDYVYSDLGMILMGEIVGKISGKSLDAYAQEEIYSPMNMSSTFFNPASSGKWLLSRISPTEIDTLTGRGLVQGRVHDERAYFMDGVAGHAGLFSSAADLAKYSMMLLNEGSYAGVEYLKPEVVRTFTALQSQISGRGYGFDRRSRSGFTTAGQLSGSDTFGHTGFTGTSIWIDREKNMAVILLTNRTFPYRSYGKRISRIRANVADAAYSAITTQ